MPIKAEVRGAQSWYYDTVTQERVAGFLPVSFYDDFIGPALTTPPLMGTAEAGVPWVRKLQGTGTTAPAAVGNTGNSINGLVRCTIGTEAEKAEATLHQNDARSWTLGQGVVMEMKVTPTVLPTGTARLIFGLAGTWKDDPMALERSVWFRVGTNGTLFAESDDNVTDTSGDTGIRLGTADTAIYRIDTTSLGTIRFYKDGADITPTGTSFPYTGSSANAQMQPYFSVYKSGSTTVATLDVDYCRLWQKRS